MEGVTVIMYTRTGDSVFPEMVSWDTKIWGSSISSSKINAEPELESECDVCFGCGRVYTAVWDRLIRNLIEFAEGMNVKIDDKELMFLLGNSKPGSIFYLPGKSERGVTIPSSPLKHDCKKCNGTGKVLTDYGKKVFETIIRQKEAYFDIEKSISK